MLERWFDIGDVAPPEFVAVVSGHRGGSDTGGMRWLARGEIELPGHDRWLSEVERAQVAGIRFTKRRQEFLTRRWAAKQAIAVVLGTPPRAAGEDHLAAIEVRNHPSGAPWVAVDDEPAPIEISLTDRAGWAICLVGAPAADERLGIDLELVEPRSERFIDDFLTPVEQEWVRSRPTVDARDAAANLVWSAKEAALKVLQVGLRADTRTVEVTLQETVTSDGWAPLGVQSREGEQFHGWWRRQGAFVLTIASRAEFEPPSALPGSADLGQAVPHHSWLERPLVGRDQPSM